jgi:hypothetical protein
MSSYCRKLEVGGTQGRKKAPLRENYSIADSKAMVTQILDTLIENAVNNSKIVATEIIDDILLIKCVYISKSDGSV